MKKYLCIIVSFVSAMAIAEETAYVKMTLTANNSKATYSVKISEDSENTDFFEDGVDAELQTLAPANSSSVFIYAIVPTTEGGTKMCSSVYDNDVLGLPLGFKTNKTETEYTISFPSVEGNLLYLRDELLETITPITTDTAYKFTAEAGQKVVENRFSIYKPSGLKVCAYYDKVEITDNMGTDNIVITTLANDTVVNVAPQMGVQTIDMSGKDAGHYVLTVNGTNYEFCNKPVSNK